MNKKIHLSHDRQDSLTLKLKDLAANLYQSPDNGLQFRKRKKRSMSTHFKINEKANLPNLVLEQISYEERMAIESPSSPCGIQKKQFNAKKSSVFSQLDKKTLKLFEDNNLGEYLIECSPDVKGKDREKGLCEIKKKLETMNKQWLKGKDTKDKELKFKDWKDKIAMMLDKGFVLIEPSQIKKGKKKKGKK